MSRALLSIFPALALAACGGDPAPTENTGASATGPAATNTAVAVESVQAANAQEMSPDAEAILASLGSAYAGADLTNGARQFRRCQSCHTLNAGGRHTVGPNLHGLIGGAAASADRFAYSSQLSEAGLVWDLETLDAWIANPRALVPGNRMSFVGLRDAEDRRDVIAYIAVETAGE
ncbi:cytochrome c family protein [Maricaulis sp.]|uniref:c-type cytochrome n=1 Tax=Maricaulis sp. TaxID=1486257 RepID=UPI0025C72094|nr:cytochrome c family protein [Maricaulis sp.]